MFIANIYRTSNTWYVNFGIQGCIISKICRKMTLWSYDNIIMVYCLTKANIPRWHVELKRSTESRIETVLRYDDGKLTK